MERKYSLSEIDQMRAFFRSRLPVPFMSWGGPIGAPMHQTDESLRSVERRNLEAEDHLRTAMGAGIDPVECIPLEQGTVTQVAASTPTPLQPSSDALD